MTDESRRSGPGVKLYALSTCVWCRKTKILLDKLGVDYDPVYVDELTSEEKETAKEEIVKLAGRISFPTLVIDGTVIVGFKEAEIRKELEG